MKSEGLDIALMGAVALLLLVLPVAMMLTWPGVGLWFMVGEMLLVIAVLLCAKALEP